MYQQTTDIHSGQEEGVCGELHLAGRPGRGEVRGQVPAGHRTRPSLHRASPDRSGGKGKRQIHLPRRHWQSEGALEKWF